MSSYNLVLLACSGVTLVMFLYSNYYASAPSIVEGEMETSKLHFESFRNKYLGVYLLMVAGDWLQGPYVYSLYSKYGFSHSEIALLFVVGFGASMVMGTFVGSLADSRGRKKFCLLYAVLYIASCCTKHVDNFYALLLGRLLGGIATSLLCSTFESWLVCECNAKQYGESKLAEVFAWQTLGNSLIAIGSGVLGQIASDAYPMIQIVSGVYMGGYTLPFDLASLAMVLGSILCIVTWEENYGERQVETFPLAALRQGLQVLQENPSVLVCGLVQSLFEGAMFSFVFEWSPALTNPDNQNELVPYGTIFATFMVCCMAGSLLVKPALNQMGKPQDVLPWVFFTSAIGLSAVPIQVYLARNDLAMYGFLMFEMMVGMYYPLMGMLKSQIVPEQHRTTLYNLFRIPLNAIVLVVLLGKFTVSQTFSICIGLLLLAAIGIRFVGSMKQETGQRRDS
ncbi:hypothetical protein BASA81_008854 [Batrachochytrium salamandrivorans]|nr:hypothetical protein BASA81_008854 [Batrachochytrium salamandrivorans]